MATAIVTTADMCDFGLVFRTVGSLETFRELTAGQFRDRLQRARLDAFCMGRVPTTHGQPKTTIAKSDEEIVQL